MSVIFQNSNLLQSGDYDTKTRTLTLTFCRGGTYTYPDVPAYLYAGIIDAISPGAFFHKNIKNQYKGTKVVEKSDDA